MEKLIGKLVISEGIGQFVDEFVTWAGPHTASARLELETTGMALDLMTRRNSESSQVSARGLAGGGEAVGAWADAEGFDVVGDEPDHVTIEAPPKNMAKTAAAVARFLAPNGKWRIVDVNARRKA